MANTLAALVKCSTRNLSPTVQSIIFNKIVPQPQIVRHLYSKSALGIDGFLFQSEKSKAQLANIADRFKTKMNEYTGDDGKSMIFTEDLKNMVHIAETSEDVDLVIKMMKKFNGQNKELRFGTFCFGPVVMRMFHHLNKSEEALTCFKSDELIGFFDQYMSYQLLLDLLYENQKYNQILEVFDIIKNKQLEGTKYPKNVVTFVLAACYKLNTAESLKYALDLWKDLINVGHVPTRRAVTFCAALALNQGQYETALEIISTAKNQSYTTVRNIKVVALAELGRADDIMLVLKSILYKDTPDGKQATFNFDVIEKAKNFMEKCDNIELKTEFEKIYEVFKNEGHVSDMTLDGILCSEITAPNFVPLAQKQRFDQNRRPFNTNRMRTRTYSNQRPGLSELQ